MIGRGLGRARPLLLDAYCGAGGAAVGYHRAGFDVVGVDHVDQPNYPFEFHKGDAVEFITRYGHLFDAGHASPPCQAHCTLTKQNRTRDGWEDTHLDLIPDTRAALDHTGLPYVIENVPGAPVRRDVMLCGEMFGLGVIRHRWFELSGFEVPQLVHRKHRGRVAGWDHGVWVDGPYFAVYGDGGGKGSVADWQGAMGIDWTDGRREIAEAIPPAYTRHVGAHLRVALAEAVPYAA